MSYLVSIMKKFMFFPLWKIETIEEYIESMEQKGYRLEKIKHSYWFYFKESKPKQMSYFLSCKSFRKSSMECCDYALLSNHGANPIESTWCFYETYRTKEDKEQLSLLYGVRADYIKAKLLECALTSSIVTAIFLACFFAAIIAKPSHQEIYIFLAIISACACFAVYYFYGYLKQKKKCREYEEHINFNIR